MEAAANIESPTALYRTRVFWVALGIVVTMGALVVTARIDRLDQPSAWGWGWVTLVAVMIPAAFFPTDLFFRSVLIVWSIAAALGFVATFGYFWWPLVMLPFAWIGATQAPGIATAKGYGLIAIAAAIGALTVPITTALVPPVETPVAVVCLTPGSPVDASNAVFTALSPSDGSFGFIDGVKGVRTKPLGNGNRAVIIGFDRYAEDGARAEAIRIVSSVPHVASVHQQAAAPGESGAPPGSPCE